MLPRNGLVKVNFDCALDKVSKFSGIGVVMRNDKGEFIGAHADRISYIVDLFIFEAMAATRALEVTLQMGFKEIELEGDALA
ncbi:hypothetical protein CRYUN_Cryun04dG0112700 [Craigia yunnanensis]